MELSIGDARYGRTLRFGLFFIGPLEFRKRGARDATRLEPPVTFRFSAGAVGPSAFFCDVERARWIDRRLAPVGFADADELDEGAIHFDESDSGMKPVLMPSRLATRDHRALGSRQCGDGDPRKEARAWDQQRRILLALAAISEVGLANASGRFRRRWAVVGNDAVIR